MFKICISKLIDIIFFPSLQLYVLDDIDPPMSPSKKTSRELAGTLRNLKKVEQALQTLERSETDLWLASRKRAEKEEEAYYFWPPLW